MNRKIQIEVMSVIDGEAWVTTYDGEYGMDGDTHLVAYNDYTGNTLTKNGLYIGPDKLLLHRVGGISCDMLFDPSQITKVDYDCFGMQTIFALKTFEYSRDITPEKIVVNLKYTLEDRSGCDPISGLQRMTIIPLNETSFSHPDRPSDIG